MNYLEFSFRVTPEDPGLEIAEAALSQLAFESFTIEDGVLKAYVREDLFDKEGFDGLFLWSLDGFDISYETVVVEQQNWNALWESNFQPIDVEGKAKFNMLYLQVPAVVSWHFNIKSVSIQPAAGVYYGFGIHGKLKGDAAKVDLFKEISVPVEDGSVEGQVFKRSDFGLRFGVGVTVMKHYYAGVGYDLGLLNISKDSGEGKIKNGSFFISLGYNF